MGRLKWKSQIRQVKIKSNAGAKCCFLFLPCVFSKENKRKYETKNSLGAKFWFAFFFFAFFVVFLTFSLTKKLTFWWQSQVETLQSIFFLKYLFEMCGVWIEHWFEVPQALRFHFLGFHKVKTLIMLNKIYIFFFFLLQRQDRIYKDKHQPIWMQKIIWDNK